MIRSLLLTIAIIFSIILNVAAQGQFDAPPERHEDENDVKNKTLGERLVFGGSLGLQFSSSSTYINISPIVGYRVTNKLTTGIGITYNYYKYEVAYIDTAGRQYITHEDDNIWGGSLWGEYRVIPQAFIHVEPGFLNLTVPDYVAQKYVRDYISYFLVGGGYYQSIGGNAGMQFSILWDLVEDKYSPYQNPIIRIGFGVGF